MIINDQKSQGNEPALPPCYALGSQPKKRQVQWKVTVTDSISHGHEVVNTIQLVNYLNEITRNLLQTYL